MVQPSPAPSTPTRTSADPSHRRRRRGWASGLAATALSVALLSGGGCATEPIPFRENPVGVLPQGSLSRGWFVDLKAAGPDQQVVMLDVRSQLVYAYTADKHVTAIDRKTGVVKFTMTVKSPESRLQPLVELAGYLVFANATNLQVFDDRGVFVKSVVVPTPVRSHAAAESNEAAGTNRGTTIYFGASGVGHGGLVEAYDITRVSAFKKWEYITHAQGAIVAAPVVFGDIIYSGDDKGEVDAVSAQRVQVWATDHGVFLTSGAITADLRADDSGLYVASNDSKLYCINRATGKLKWQYFAGEQLSVPPILTPDTIYQMTSHHGLAALEKAAPAPGPTDKPTAAYDRAPKWTCPEADQFLAQDAKYTYVAESRANPTDPELPPQRWIVALDKQTGQPAFESEHHDFTIFGTNPRDGLVYVGFADGKLMALQPVLHAGQVGELVMVPVAPPTAVAMAR